MSEHIKPTVGGGRTTNLKVIVSICDTQTHRHACERGHAAAFREQAVHVVVHRANGVATVGVHLHPAKLQFTKSGEQAITDLLTHWHAMDYHSIHAQPKSYLDPLRARWLGLKEGILDRVIADVQTFLATPHFFAPLVIPRALDALS